ncbi:acyl-CoA thioester hydrolase YciA [Buchnera aphidicola (Ceratoglyphina bambusae)]|uniref:acyl-CoA thioester hydrolase YciA n=1 Tax=Buchnera aphidicola TaxID=9 RepID=UPI0031B88A59
MKKLKKNKPTGKLVLKTLAMPKNTNASGDIFGGWIMSQIDLGGAILAKEISKGNVTTLMVKNIIFLKPISVGDVVNCYAKLITVGNSSMEIKVEIWIKKVIENPIGSIYCTSKANLIYVAIDDNKKSRPVYKNFCNIEN